VIKKLWLFRLLFLICLFTISGYLAPLTTQAQNPVRRVNAPYFSSDFVPSEQAAIFWFGQVDPINNHANVRVGYNDDMLQIDVHIFDRRVWYDETPDMANLADWDAVTVYLNLDGKTGNNPSTNAYQFVAQINPIWQTDRSDYQAVFKGDGSGWEVTPISFTTTSFYRGDPNSNVDDRGWQVSFEIPFSSLGLSNPPPFGTDWGLAMVLHDRDDQTGVPSISDQTWPESIDPQQPSTWGELNFGLPVYTPESATPGGVVTIRQGLNGASVPDAHVGGHSICGDPYDPDYFSGWGDANYAGYSQINIQNQWDVADWPCFSKYYITFPLDALPADKTIISATLTMYQFGGAWGPPPSSLIQVLTIAEDWDEFTITWNNAPLAAENFAGSWVDPLSSYPGSPGIPRQFDVSQAVAQAYEGGMPLRLALYSADGDYHSGKYFWSSDAGGTSSPTLDIVWGNSNFDLKITPPIRLIDAGDVATYTVQIQHSYDFTHTVDLEVGPPSPNEGLLVNLIPPTSFPKPGGQTNVVLTHQDSTLPYGLWYTIPITATGGGFTKTESIHLLVNGQQVFLPLVLK